MAPKICAILLMAGQGTRFGSALPKQFCPLSGKPVYLHTLLTFTLLKEWEAIILVCPPHYRRRVEKEVQEVSDSRIQVVDGGLSRAESSYLGLKACPSHTEYVVIHDAVRPFVSKRILKDNIQAALQFNAVDTCIGSADTLVQTKGDGKIEAIPLRETLLRGQTPQSFSYHLLLKAHELARDTPLYAQVSDDCRLVIALGHPVRIVRGAEENIKITTEIDLMIAEYLMRRSYVPEGSSLTSSSLKGQLYAVVGATGGIGSQICRALQDQGAEVIPISRHTVPYAADVTDPRQVETLFARIAEDKGPLDGLILCAGLLKISPLRQLLLSEMQHLLDVNLMGVFYCCHSVRLKEGGHIVNMASSSYARGRKDYAVYSAAKAAVVNFTQGFAEENRQWRVNAVIPSRTDTPMRRENFPLEDPSLNLSPQQVANSVIELLSRKDLTGQIIEVKNV